MTWQERRAGKLENGLHAYAPCRCFFEFFSPPPPPVVEVLIGNHVVLEAASTSPPQVEVRLHWCPAGLLLLTAAGRAGLYGWNRPAATTACCNYQLQYCRSA